MAHGAPFHRPPGEMPLELRVLDDGHFARLGAELVTSHRGFDAALLGVARDVAPLAATTIDPEFIATIGPTTNDPPPFDEGPDGETVSKISGALDATENELGKLYYVLPDPDGLDYDIDTPPVVPPAPDPKDIIAAPTPTPPPSGLLSPDEVHAIAVAWIEAHTHAPATEAQLVALADAAGYVQGTSVSRAFVETFLASPAALHAIGL